MNEFGKCRCICRSNVIAKSGNTRPTKHTSQRFESGCGRWMAGSQAERQPVCRQPRFDQPFGPVALGGKQPVEMSSLVFGPFCINMRVDRPPGTGPQIVRKVVAQPVVNIQIQIEALSAEFVPILWQEEFNVRELLPPAGNTRRSSQGEAVLSKMMATRWMVMFQNPCHFAVRADCPVSNDRACPTAPPEGGTTSSRR